jgi:hypothetical protein
MSDNQSQDRIEIPQAKKKERATVAKKEKSMVVSQKEGAPQAVREQRFQQLVNFK